MNYKVIDLNNYYRKGVFEYFSKDAKCSTSITHRVDVTQLKEWSKITGSSFYLNFLYVLSRALNERDDYRMAWLYETEQLICYDKINPTQYVFHEDTETITVAYTEYEEDYHIFYENGVVKMPVSVRLNHAVADGYSVARVFTLIEEEKKMLVL